MKKLEKLINTKNTIEFSHLLGYQPKMLSYILYKMPDLESPYASFPVYKKTGGVRIINAPNEKLKLLQRRLADFLYDCYDEIMQEKKGTVGLSHGFRRGYSIYTNSLKHCKKRYVFNVDLKDFFSIH